MMYKNRNKIIFLALVFALNYVVNYSWQILYTYTNIRQNKINANDVLIIFVEYFDLSEASALLSFN